jgi:hypothetical protein
MLGSAPAGAPRRRPLLLGSLLVALVLVAGVALLTITSTPGDGDGTSDSAAAPSPQGTLQPTASLDQGSPAASATAATGTLAITGGITIVSPGQDPRAESSQDPDDRRRKPETPWAPVQAELDALVARRDSGDLSPSEFLAAYENVGCVGSGEFSDFVPGRSIDVRDEGGEVIA